MNITKEVDMVVQNVYPPPELNNNIKMEVRFEVVVDKFPKTKTLKEIELTDVW